MVGLEGEERVKKWERGEFLEVGWYFRESEYSGEV